MKIKPEHYAVIAAALDAQRARFVEAARHYRNAGASPLRYRWDVFRAAQIEGNTTRWICDALYPYLNDSHIDSALRAYFKSWEGEQWPATNA